MTLEELMAVPLWDGHAPAALRYRGNEYCSGCINYMRRQIAEYILAAPIPPVYGDSRWPQAITDLASPYEHFCFDCGGYLYGDEADEEPEDDPEDDDPLIPPLPFCTRCGEVGAPSYHVCRKEP